jgi:15-cis-phytoene desaturase
MAAAVQLSEAGYQVQVLEANAQVGGRTSSWTEDGVPIESGLHRFLGFYTALPDILKQVGINLDDMLCWEDEIEVRTPGDVAVVLGLAPLHKPFKTAAGLLAHNDFLTPADKLALTNMFAAGAKEYITNPSELDQKTVLDFAHQHHVSERAITHLLIPLTEGIFFLPISQYSMYNLMGLFMSYLKSLPKLRVGAFTGGMTEVMMQPMVEYVTARGGTIHTSTPVEELLVEEQAVVGVMAGGKPLPADYVILAASLHGAQTILQRNFAQHPSLQDMFRLPTMPAVTFQLELKEPCLPVDRTTFGPTTALASFAEQSRTTFRGSKGRLSVILSPPEQFLDMPADDILKVVVQDGERLGLHLHDNVLAYRRVRLPHDFYALSTGNEQLRPPQRTDIPGLTLAGDYTKQPYLATMEGAVVSGKLAAEIIMEDHA